MLKETQYLTNSQGDRIGVVLDLYSYQQYLNWLAQDPEILLGLSSEELQALAQIKLAPEAQNQLSELLAKNALGTISQSEIDMLDQIISQIDRLNILKTRAQYTLSQWEKEHN